MSRPFALPPRESDDRRVRGSAAENFAKQTPLNLIEWLDNMERRLKEVENRISRIYVPGG